MSSAGTGRVVRGDIHRRPTEAGLADAGPPSTAPHPSFNRWRWLGPGRALLSTRWCRRQIEARSMSRVMVLSGSRVLALVGALALLAQATPVGAVSTDTFVDFGNNKHLFSQSKVYE